MYYPNSGLTVQLNRGLIKIITFMPKIYKAALLVSPLDFRSISE